jgi:hypothetical protein
VNHSTLLEQQVQDALRDAADHAPLAPPTPLADASTRVPLSRTTIRSRALIAACVVALGVVVIIAAVTATSDDNLRVATSGSTSHEVPPDELSRSESDVFVYFLLDATDQQVAAVRAQLETSPEVARFAFLDHDAAKRDFDNLYSCDPELRDALRPEDLPVSFRVATIDEQDAAARVQLAFGNAAGVQLADTRTNSFGVPARSNEVVPEFHAPCWGDPHDVSPSPAPPSIPPTAPSISPTTPPTLPAAGDPPSDPTSARDAVVAAFTQAWDGSSTVEARRAAMQGSDDLSTELDRARQGNEAMIASMRAIVGDVTFVTPDRAAVVFHVEFQAGLVQPTLLGYAVLDDGTWKVSRETVCAVLSTAAGVSCPAG